MIDWGWLLFPVAFLLCAVGVIADCKDKNKNLLAQVDRLGWSNRRLEFQLSCLRAERDALNATRLEIIKECNRQSQEREERLTAKIQELVRANADLAVNAKVVKTGK